MKLPFARITSVFSLVLSTSYPPSFSLLPSSLPSSLPPSLPPSLSFPQLLHPDEDQRIQSVEQMRRHRFFDILTWAEVEDKTAKPSYIPPVSMTRSDWSSLKLHDVIKAVFNHTARYNAMFDLWSSSSVKRSKCHVIPCRVINSCLDNIMKF